MESPVFCPLIEGGSLPRQVIESILNLQKTFEMGTSFGVIHKLIEPWTFLSRGGDGFKLIVVADFHVEDGEFGVFVKRYITAEMAQVVFSSYQAIAQFVETYRIPISMPIGILGDAFVFPRVNIRREYDVYYEDSEIFTKMKEVDSKLHTLLAFADRIQVLVIVDVDGQEKHLYTDVFEDSVRSIMQALGQW